MDIKILTTSDSKSFNDVDILWLDLPTLIEHEPYIVKFLDQVTDFMIEKGHETLLKHFQSILHDLAEYLRVRNG